MRKFPHASREADAFLQALEALCRDHAIQLTVTPDGLRLEPLEPGQAPLNVAVIEDATDMTALS